MMLLMWIVTLAFALAVFVLSARWFLPRSRQNEYDVGQAGNVQRAHQETMALHNWGGGTRTSRNLR